MWLYFCRNSLDPETEVSRDTLDLVRNASGHFGHESEVSRNTSNWVRSAR